MKSQKNPFLYVSLLFVWLPTPAFKPVFHLFRLFHILVALSCVQPVGVPRLRGCERRRKKIITNESHSHWAPWTSCIKYFWSIFLSLFGFISFELCNLSVTEEGGCDIDTVLNLIQSKIWSFKCRMLSCQSLKSNYLFTFIFGTLPSLQTFSFVPEQMMEEMIDLESRSIAQICRKFREKSWLWRSVFALKTLLGNGAYVSKPLTRGQYCFLFLS